MYNAYGMPFVNTSVTKERLIHQDYSTYLRDKISELDVTEHIDVLDWRAVQDLFELTIIFNKHKYDRKNTHECVICGHKGTAYKYTYRYIPKNTTIVATNYKVCGNCDNVDTYTKLLDMFESDALNDSRDSVCNLYSKLRVNGWSENHNPLWDNPNCLEPLLEYYHKSYQFTTEL